MNESGVAQLHSLVEREQENICGMAAFRDGAMVYQDTWHGFEPTDAMNVMSVTKSVVSLLVGIAMDQGLIESVEQRVLDFFPDYPVKRGEKTIGQVTLGHLLTMTAPYKYRSEPWTKVCTSGDWTKAALDLLGGRAGITGEFKYATLGIQILTGLVARVSGMPAIDFANRYLFEPLGIPSHRNAADSSKEEQLDFLMSKLPRENVWYADPMGVNTAGWGLCLAAGDMARIGQMCLDKGVYQGRRVVSEAWLAESTKPRMRLGEQFGNMAYGYLWWTVDEDAGAYAAIGDGGNVIYVNPATHSAVGVAATFKPRVFDRVQFIQRHVEPLLDGLR